jgi:hypothetical protein
LKVPSGVVYFLGPSNVSCSPVQLKPVVVCLNEIVREVLL